MPPYCLSYRKPVRLQQNFLLYVPETHQKSCAPLLPQSPPKRLEMHRTFLCQLTVRSLLPCIQFSRNVQSLRIELFTLKPWTGFVRLKYLFSTGEMFDFLTDAEWDDWRFFFCFFFYIFLLFGSLLFTCWGFNFKLSSWRHVVDLQPVWIMYAPVSLWSWNLCFL